MLPSSGAAYVEGERTKQRVPSFLEDCCPVDHSEAAAVELDRRVRCEDPCDPRAVLQLLTQVVAARRGDVAVIVVLGRQDVLPNELSSRFGCGLGVVHSHPFGAWSS